MSAYEPVIGLEVHAQLKTRTKLFCGCAATYGAAPNTRTCPVCLGHPGALPMLNRAAVDLAVRTALALGCTVHPTSVFARKNYFYPDLPKGYQISQYDRPLAGGGTVRIESGGADREIGLIRLHLEEDAGKSIHDGMPDSDRATYLDLNRCGVPLVEIVTRPEIRSPEEAYLFLRRLRSILRYVEVCDGNLEEGSMRCDANVSIRREGSEKLGTRTELKNLNSFRNVQRALEAEIHRQVALVSAGGSVERETVEWSEETGEIRSARSKEEPSDYRYFPEPDLPPLVLDEDRVETIRGCLPELPAERKRRFIATYRIPESDAQLLTEERELADYFESVAHGSGEPKTAANFVLNELLRELKSSGRSEAEIPLPAKNLSELIRMVRAGAVSLAAARGLFAELYRTGRPPRELVDERGLAQVSDEASLRALARGVLDSHPEQVRDYRDGKEGILGFFVGKAMEASNGKADPVALNAVLRELIERDGQTE